MKMSGHGQEMDKQAPKTRGGPERLNVIIFSVYSIAMMAVTIREGWPIWLVCVQLFGILFYWIVSGKASGDTHGKAHMIVLMYMFEVLLYIMQMPNPLFASGTVLTSMICIGLYGFSDLMVYPLLMLIIAIIYHGPIMNTYGGDPALGTGRILLQIMNLFVAEFFMYFWLRMRSKSEQMTKEVIRELKVSERSREEFLANVSHEVRTPVNTIIGLSELTIRETNMMTIKENLFHIQTAGRNMVSVVSDMLDFSELQSGKMELELEEYNLASTINDVMNMAMARRGEKDIQIIVDCDPNLPCSVLGDEKKIRRVIMNFINNAIKFTNEGYVWIRVSGRKEEYGMNLLVEVMDTGIGISEEGMEQIFEKFTQLDGGSNRQWGGMGLGLAIAQASVRKMGGIITMNSKVGRGTGIRCVIPQKVLDERPMIHLEERTVSLCIYFNMERYGFIPVRDAYSETIRNMVENLDIRAHICRNLSEMKRRVERDDFSHVFISYAEYLEDKSYFEKLAEKVQVVLLLEREEMLHVTDGRFIRVIKPLCVLSVVSALNGVESKRIQTEETKEGRLRATGVRALVVDDNLMNIKVMEGLLRRYDIEVDMALSGRDALRKIESMKYNLVFMDHMMPEMDGIETFHRIREKAGAYYQKVPVIALTANAVAGARDMFMEEGFDDFLEKPVEISVLERVLQRNLLVEMFHTKEITGEKEEEGRTPADTSDSRTERYPDKKGQLQLGDLDVETGIAYCGGREEYIDILRMYRDSGRENREDIASLYVTQNWKDYVIAVHALKSSMLSIGAKNLSAMAKELELAGKENKIEFIAAHHDEMMEEYLRIIEILERSPVLGATEAQQEDEATEDEREEELKEVEEQEVEAQIQALEDAAFGLDKDTMESIISKMEQCSYHGVALKQILKGVRKKIEMSDYLSASELAGKNWEQCKKGGEHR